jgi:hypothetical protein
MVLHALEVLAIVTLSPEGRHQLVTAGVSGQGSGTKDAMAVLLATITAGQLNTLYGFTNQEVGTKVLVVPSAGICFLYRFCLMKCPCPTMMYCTKPCESVIDSALLFVHCGLG